MCRLIETIQCHNGKICNIDYHNFRFNRSRKELFGIQLPVDLKKIIEIPDVAKSGIYRCRILYGKEIENIEFIKQQFRKITSLQLVQDDEIDYRHKFSDRDRLTQLFEKRGDCDDVLIVKNGYLTDSFTANVVFFDGVLWWTPDTPLLPGTQRAFLLDNKMIFQRPIKPNEIKTFEKAGLINAMQNLESMPEISVKNIKISTH